MPTAGSNYGSHSAPRYAVSNGAEVCRSVATLGQEKAEMAISRSSRRCLLTVALALGGLFCGVCTPRPFISSISPSSATAGGNQLLLTVNGIDFRPASLMSWNGSFRVTTFVNSHQLVAAVSATEIAAPGTVLVLVFNPPESRTVSVSGAIGSSSSNLCSGKNSNAVSFTINT